MGTASGSLFEFNGKTLGISGVLGGALKVRSSEAPSRWAFVVGMLAAGGLMTVVMPGAFKNTIARSAGALLLAGTLVGAGSQLGSGGTSGHGICGIGRFSPRSIVATVVFMFTGAGAALFVRHILAGTA